MPALFATSAFEASFYGKDDLGQPPFDIEPVAQLRAPGPAVGASMNPLAATIPEGLVGNDTVATQCPALWSPGMDLQRLFRFVVFLAQFS